MIISLIVAMDEEGGIGLSGGLPWYLPADLKHFKTITMGHHLIMGRLTYESIGRPLPGRTMIILTRNKEYKADGCIVTHSLEKALEIARSGDEEEVFIIGGGDVFSQAIAGADKIYLTRIHTKLSADVFFPKIHQSEWQEIASDKHAPDERNPYAYSFIELSRIVEQRSDANEFQGNSE